MLDMTLILTAGGTLLHREVGELRGALGGVRNGWISRSGGWSSGGIPSSRVGQMTGQNAAVRRPAPAS
jgi:hypothetical protein